MINEQELAKVICEANITKNIDKMFEEGRIAGLSASAVRLAVAREVATGWQKFLPEARAVLKALGAKQTL